MADLGVEMMRQRLRRQDPDASEDEIRSRLAEWLQTRPGAEHGAAWGVKGTREVDKGWPRG